MRQNHKKYLSTLSTLFCLGALLSVSLGLAQSDRPNPKTTANPEDYSVSPRNRGGRTRLPQNYDKYYYRYENGYVLNPNLYAPQYQQSRVLGPVKRYTDVEYGRLMSSLLEATKVVPATSSNTSIASIASMTTETALSHDEARPIQVRVLDVLDRGVLFIDTREEVRLRGVRIPSEKSTNEVLRLYSREAAKRVRDLAEGQSIYVLLDEPVRGSDGLVLVNAFLADGTDLNRLLISEGFGQIETSDFLPSVQLQDLFEAQQLAKNNHLGIWSRNF